MHVMVMLFAAARELTGRDEMELELPEKATIAEARRAIVERFPALGPLLARSAIARDHEYAVDEDQVNAGDELAVIPPVSGG